MHVGSICKLVFESRWLIHDLQQGAVRLTSVLTYSADEGSVQDNDGTSRGFGFINFENAEEAAVAVEKNNGSILEGKEIWCGRAQKKAEREAELKQK